jgi:endonuclease/exonuclease/phosphatase family metal-dependent hydrolase
MKYPRRLVVKIVLCMAPFVWIAVAPAARRPMQLDPLAGSVPRNQQLAVVSLNVAKSMDIERMASELTSTPRVAEADVYLLQEVAREGSDPSAAEQLAARLRLYVVFGSPESGSTGSGLAILSRYPLTEPREFRLKENNVIFRSRKRMALGATVAAPFGPVRIFNTHLDTRVNPGARCAQLEPIVSEAEVFQGPKVVGGDLNTNPARWISHLIPIPFLRQSGPVHRMMARLGYSTPFLTTGPTHDLLGMQLDWIYVKDARTLSAAVEPIAFSDHHAIWTQVAPLEVASAQAIH